MTTRKLFLPLLDHTHLGLLRQWTRYGHHCRTRVCTSSSSRAALASNFIDDIRCNNTRQEIRKRYYVSTPSINNYCNNDNDNSQQQSPRQQPSFESKRLSVAIVGAGPSGFYAAKYLMSSMSKRILLSQSTTSLATNHEEVAVGEHGEATTVATPSNFDWSGVDIDIIERLPTPYGLVRYGVAPDHPEVKNVEHDFASLFVSNNDHINNNHNITNNNNNDNQLCTLSYVGNVNVGTDVSLSSLSSIYDIVILAYGCQESDKRLNIPGEDTLQGVLSAREFVAWYNGHPEFGHVGAIVKQSLWKDNNSKGSNNDDSISSARVVVIGQGNVALDVARILVKGTNGLINTDIPSSVLHILRQGVSHVSVVGRRGHIQGAFTIKELRELTKLKEEGYDTSFVVRKEELELGMTDSSTLELKGPSGRPKTRIDKLLQESAVLDNDEIFNSSTKQVELRFLLNPIRLESSEVDNSRVGRVVCERTKLVGDPLEQKSVGTEIIETLSADLVLVSIGYRGLPLAGLDDLGHFDDRKGIVSNEHGKVVGDNNLFVTGWIKRGPTGIIGTNISDAKETVASVIKYVDSGYVQKKDPSTVVTGRAGLAAILHSSQIETVCWHRFCKIDAFEVDRSRCRNNNQPREKLVTIDDMLNVAN
jgi:adrenodoxin-NADP+ reductase